MKTLRFFGASLQELAALHNEWVRRRAAFELRQMQMGLPNNFTQMPAPMSVAGVQAYERLARRRVRNPRPIHAPGNIFLQIARNDKTYPKNSKKR